MNTVAIAVIALHAPVHSGLAPEHYYCAECISPIDGGPANWPCLTFKVVIDALSGNVISNG